MDETSDCRAFLVHWKSAHRQLHDVVRGVRDILNEPAPQSLEAIHASWANGGSAPLPSAADLKAQLSHLRDELSRHFDEEEAGGCIEEAVSRLPGLASEARRVEQQHPTLLAHLDHMLRLVDSGRLSDMRLAFAEFDEELRSHERLEDRIIEHGFNTSLDNGYVVDTVP